MRRSGNFILKLLLLISGLAFVVQVRLTFSAVGGEDGNRCGEVKMEQEGILPEWLRSIRDQDPPSIDRLYFTPWSGDGENGTLFRRPRIYTAVDQLDNETLYLKWSHFASDQWGTSNKYFFILEYMYAAALLGRTLILPEYCIDRSSNALHQCDEENRREFCRLFVQRDGIAALPTELLMNISALSDDSNASSSPSVIFMSLEAFDALKVTQATEQIQASTPSGFIAWLKRLRPPTVLIDTVVSERGDAVDYLGFRFLHDFYMMNWFYRPVFKRARRSQIVDLKKTFGRDPAWILGLDDVRFGHYPTRIHFGSPQTYRNYIHIAQTYTVPNEFVMAVAHRILAKQWPGFAARGYGPKLCIHWRRGDFATQWKWRMNHMERGLVDGIESCHARCGERNNTLIITDETDGTKLDEMRARNVTIIDDLFVEFGLTELPLLAHKNVRGLISQVVCGTALGFAGLKQSSFSNRIVNMRGDGLKSQLFSLSIDPFSSPRQVLESVSCEKVFLPAESSCCFLRRLC